MVTSSSINFFKYFFCQGIQALKGSFIERNVANSSFHLIKYHSSTKTVYNLCAYIYIVATNLAKLVYFGVA